MEVDDGTFKLVIFILNLRLILFKPVIVHPDQLYNSVLRAPCVLYSIFKVGKSKFFLV